MSSADSDDALLRSVALQNAHSIQLARQQAEDALLRAKRDLERKTDELARSLATTTATLESTTDGILATDNRGRIIAWNRRFLVLTGFSAEELASSDYRNLAARFSLQVRRSEEFLRRLDEIEGSGISESYDVLEFSDGRAVERFSRIQYVDGHANGRVWSYRDITERHRTEQALGEEKRTLALLNKTGAMLASTLDLDALLQAATDAATTLTGAQFGAFFYNSLDAEGERYVLYTLSGAPRSAFEKFGHPRATALFAPTFNGAPPIRVDDVLADPRYGHSAPHHGMPPGHLPVRSYLAVPVISRSGEVLGGLFLGHARPAVFDERAESLVCAIASQAAMAIDNARLYESAQRAAAERELLLERERAARAAAERMSAMKDEFLATLSHELRTPLGAILGWAQILRRGVKSEQDLNRGLDTIERNARLQAQLIEDLLDMSRINSGKLRLDMQVIRLEAVIEAAAASVRPQAATRQIGLELVLDPAAGSVMGDAGRLQQVVWNLLSNAIKFSQTQGVVQLRLARAGGMLEIAVVDQGAGIAPDFLPHVFDRFRQADGSTTRNHGGLGLGLSIVKSLTDMHGGTVRVASEGAGCGATFTVALPAVADEAVAGEGADSVPSFVLTDLGGLTILVVDDEADARDMVRRILEDCGASVLSAASAEEGLATLQRERPDVLVSDIGMPQVDGYEFVRRLRLLDPAQGGRTPAIALTAFARTQDRTQAFRAGFLAHVAKPVEPSELVATVASVAGRAGKGGNALPG